MNSNAATIQNAPDEPVDSAREWERLLSERFAPGRVTLSNRGPAGTLRLQPRLDRLWVARVSVWPQAIAHSARHLDALPADDRSLVVVHVVVEGRGVVEQSGMSLPFRAGDISFRNLAEPSRIVFETPGTFYAVRLPSTVLTAHDPRRAGRHRFAPRIARGTIPEITRRLLTGSAPGAATGVDDFYASLALPWLFAACYHGDGSPVGQPRPSNELRWRQIVGHVDEHAFDADAMSAASCARAVGISERYLHKLFAQHDLRFSRTVLQRRLAAAHSLLECPAYTSLSIASIAYQCGFKDAAHFSRAFRQRFGESPRQCRERAAHGR